MSCATGAPSAGSEFFCRCDHPNNSYDGQLWVIETDANGGNARDVVFLGGFDSTSACEDFMFRHPQCNSDSAPDLAVNVDGTNYSCGGRNGGYPRRYCRCDHPNNSYDGQLWIIEATSAGNLQDVRHVRTFGSNEECHNYLVRTPECRL